MRRDRISWLDEGGKVALDDYARTLESYVQALADGVITKQEVDAQEGKVVALMKEIEPLLDDELHRKVTDLLLQVTVFDMLQMMHAVNEARPTSRFRG